MIFPIIGKTAIKRKKSLLNCTKIKQDGAINHIISRRPPVSYKNSVAEVLQDKLPQQTTEDGDSYSHANRLQNSAPFPTT